MKLQILTDLHLEFGGDTFPKTGDVLLLAGDICVGKHLEGNGYERKTYDRFFKGFCNQFDQVYMICGNHEFYGGEMNKIPQDLVNYFRGTKVVLLDNEVVRLNDTHELFAGTFWTDHNNKNPNVILKANDFMNDHRVIKLNGRRFHPVNAVLRNQIARFRLKDAIRNCKNKLVVMTHHGLIFPPKPGPSATYDEFDWMFYNTGLEGLFFEEKIDLMVHGHTHDTYDYTCGNVRVVVNPRGYNGMALNPAFDPGFCVDI